jgi:hypothetical protein
MMRQIEVSVDVFARIWSARLPQETSEDQILGRLLKLPRTDAPETTNTASADAGGTSERATNRPKSKRWTDVLTWALEQFGGKATLAQIYKKSREGRAAIGVLITPHHDDSARECLESHCPESRKYRGKAALFYMPAGKGAGIWALR